ncbi:PQ loop repeat family protein [Histomonas meleagridis]|uniref:PQ loop repeat family protein n=1 Tax=Histomonas meleagridis TaxID=135588 RepID=UPI003559C680|nr:PQ loop repeat family protein [Histomonas meleagridis]KAH0802468.1 PQ loop repeat family protein [Histomonas meleagridis]
MYAQIPQIILFFKTGQTEGFSFAFICLLLFGDTCNLVGAIINHKLVTQIITATWYVLVDTFTLFQYIYLRWFKGKCSKKEEVIIDEQNPLSISPLLLPSAASAISLFTKQSGPYDSDQIFGTILGWCSCVSYAISRIPQIAKNCKRRMITGFSYKFSICAILGNATYTISIFCKDYHWPYIWGQLPWVIGAAGLLFFDFAIIGQVIAFRNNKASPEEYVSLATDALEGQQQND